MAKFDPTTATPRQFNWERAKSLPSDARRLYKLAESSGMTDEEICVALDYLGGEILEDNSCLKDVDAAYAYMMGFKAFEKHDEETWVMQVLPERKGTAPRDGDDMRSVLRHVTPEGWACWTRIQMDAYEVRFGEEGGRTAFTTISGKLLVHSHGWKNNSIIRELYEAVWKVERAIYEDFPV